MNNKLLTFNLFLIFMALNICLKGEEIYVWAESGINLRSQPSIQSDIITHIPYGERLVQSTSNQQKEKLQVTNDVGDTKGLKINGKWLDVSFNNIQGYVFSAWVSRYPAPKSYDMHEYFNSLTKTQPDTLKTGRTTKINFGNEIFVSNHQSEGCAVQTTIQMNDTTFEEGFLLCYHFLNIDNSSKRNLKNRWVSEDEYYELIKNDANGFSFHSWIVQIDYFNENNKTIIVL